MSRINHFKSQISLVEFILSRPSLGFKISDKSKKNAIVVYREIKDEHSNAHKVDNLIISRYFDGETSYDYFFKTTDDFRNNSKTIVDFIHEYVLHKLPQEKPDFAKIFGILDQYIKSDKYVDPNESKWEMKIHQKRDTVELPDNLRDLIKQPTQETFNYLQSRNINQDTYFNSLFLSTYGSYTHILKSNDNSQTTYRRPVFLYLNSQNRLQTFQQIVEFDDKREKWFAKGVDRGEALYKSEKTKSTNLIVITEAPEKCMAHYQLSYEQMKNDNLVPYYLATGGNVSKEQLNHMSNIINEMKLPVVISYDKDKSGDLYTLKTLASIVSKDFCEFSHVTINDQQYLGITLNDDQSKIKNEKHFNVLQSFRGDLINLYSKIPHTERDSKGFTTFIKLTDDNVNSVINSLMNRVQEHMKIPISKHVPVTKDWVDDLERKHTLKRDVHIHPRITIDNSSSRFRKV